jgi:hypothetical protein
MPPAVFSISPPTGFYPETAERYLDYCLKNCDWNDFQFKKPDEKQLQAAW